MLPIGQKFAGILPDRFAFVSQNLRPYLLPSVSTSIVDMSSFPLSLEISICVKRKRVSEENVQSPWDGIVSSFSCRFICFKDGNQIIMACSNWVGTYSHHLSIWNFTPTYSAQTMLWRSLHLRLSLISIIIRVLFLFFIPVIALYVGIYFCFFYCLVTTWKLDFGLLSLHVNK
jgi:hypothetical protein